MWGATVIRSGRHGKGANFNPRSPCGERRRRVYRADCSGDFNPRSPCGERRFGFAQIHVLFDFNPRSPCGERRMVPKEDAEKVLFQSTLPVWGATGFEAQALQRIAISIHAPRVGSDPIAISTICFLNYFNPRSPCGERLRYLKLLPERSVISIHAPRVGSDSLSAWVVLVISYFNPRSPCGERLQY